VSKQSNPHTRAGLVRALIDAHGRTYAEEAGITLRNKPSPLYQLMVMTLLSSARIGADIAMASARELFLAGWRTPEHMRASTWQQRVDALGRGGYRRYDESTATKLDENAAWVLEHYHGDLRELRAEDGDPDELVNRLTAAPRIGPVGAGIFIREVQGVWPELQPFFDDRALDEAARLGLPRNPADLAELAPRGDVPVLASALVRSGSRARRR
jgi:hypothetical protein